VLEIEYGDIESLEAIRRSLAGSAAQFASIGEVNPESPGAVITAGYEYSPPPVSPALAGEGLILYAIDLTFGTEEISTRSDKTQLKAPAPYVLMNNEDAGESGLKDGERVKITSGDLCLTCDLKVSESCARGAAFAPRLHGFDAAALSGKRVKITGGAK